MNLKPPQQKREILFTSKEEQMTITKENYIKLSKSLEEFVKAGKKQRGALSAGGWGHASWCNYPRPEGSGEGKCNCGVADLQTAIKKYETKSKNYGIKHKRENDEIQSN